MTDSLTVYLSGDAWQGNAKATITVNGVSVGGVLTTSAVNAAGQTQAFTLTGNFGPTPQVSVTFINDASNGLPGDDRNLYLDGFAYDGVMQLGDQAALYYDHSVTYTLTSTPAVAERAATFIGATGVDVHLDYLNTSYANFSLVKSALAYLGADDIRVSVPTAQTLPKLEALAALGYNFDILLPEASTDAQLAQELAALAPIAGSVSAIEGPNEVNLTSSFSWDGQTGPAAAVAYQAAISAAVAADPKLSSADVYAFSLGAAPPSEIALYGNLTPYSTDGNMHVYYVNNEPPESEIQFNLGLDAISNPGQPAVITETNYVTAPALGGVTNAVQASYDLDLLMDAAKAGIAETFFYELLDWSADPKQTSVQFHNGLFNADGTPKPAATAIHNLSAILADPGATAASFTPGSLRYTVTGLPSSGDTYLLEKSSGVYDLAVWAEPVLWNSITDTAITPTPFTVQVLLANQAASVSVFDPLAGTAPIAQYTNVSSIPLTITDHPLILQITPQDRLAVAGTVTPQTVALGNEHVGDTVTAALSVANTAAADGLSEALDASIAATTSAITASGGFTGLAAGATDASDLQVGLNTATAGVKAGTAVVSLSSDGAGIDAGGITALGTQTVSVTGTVYAYATPTLSTTIVNLGAVRVGGRALAQRVSLTNSGSASAFQESLVYAGGAAPAGFAITNAAGTLAVGSSALLKVSMGTATAGTFTGTETLSLTSSGAGTSGLGNTTLAPQTLTLQGQVYALAVAQLAASSIDFGVVHVGDTVSQSLAVTNAATGALTDSLTGGTAALTGAAGPVGFALGSGLASGASGTVSIGLNTATSGTVSGSAALGFASNDPSLTDVAVSGGTVSVTGTVDAYASLAVVSTGGVGTLSQNGTSYTLDLGTLALAAGSVSVGFGVTNAATGLADLLSGSFATAGGAGFTNAGLDAYAGLTAGATDTAPLVTLSTATAGTFTEVITLTAAGSNASGYSGALAPETLTITGTVVPTAVVSSGDAGVAGVAGGAGQSATATANTPGASGNSALAQGGNGADGSAAGPAGAGGGATASASSSSTTGPATAVATATGGQGGNASGSGNKAGPGGMAAGSTASATGTTAATATVIQTSGNGGIGSNGAAGGNGAASQLVNAVTGATDGGLLSLTQTAIGGNGGDSDTGAGGNGGLAVSTLAFDDTQNTTGSAAINALVTATGGDGDVTGGNGNFAAGSGIITGTGNVTLQTTATGGSAGDGGTLGGSATATSIASGTQVNAAATANAGIGSTVAATGYATVQATSTSGTVTATTTTGLSAGNLIIGESASSVAAVNGASTAISEVAMGKALPWWGTGANSVLVTLPTTATLAPVLAAAPNTSTVFGAGSTILAVGEVGGGHSGIGTDTQTSTGSTDITLDLLQLTNTPDLFLSLTKGLGSTSGVSDIKLSVTANGTSLLTHEFSSVVTATAWFTDHPLDLGSLAASGALASSPTLDLEVVLAVTTTKAGGSFNAGFLIGDAHATQQ